MTLSQCTCSSPIHDWTTGCPEIGPLLYFLKRYPGPGRPETFGIEAGAAYEDKDTGEEVIRCAGSFYKDDQPHEYRYKDGIGSDADGWRLD